MVRKMCRSSSIFPLDPWPRALICVSVSAFPFCSSSCLCPCSERSCDLASVAVLAPHQNSLSVLPMVCSWPGLWLQNQKKPSELCRIRVGTLFPQQTGKVGERETAFSEVLKWKGTGSQKITHEHKIPNGMTSGFFFSSNVGRHSHVLGGLNANKVQPRWGRI